MLIYLVDDRGARGEYANFIQAYSVLLPPIELCVFTHWEALYSAVESRRPDGLLADMRFDETPTDQLYGDIGALANTDQFCGNRARAEAQVRGMQGLMIVRALRERGVDVPAILFAPFPENVRARIIAQTPNLDIIEGLRFEAVKAVLEQWQQRVIT